MCFNAHCVANELCALIFIELLQSTHQHHTRKWTIISPVDDFSETDKVTPATEQHLPTADDTLSRHTTLTVKMQASSSSSSSPHL
ncbi:hypothetical protein TYRP_019286 [Tyrophagus putrescentiae]|nr:hypothetical protein TYRP_019286 [Tyrophagus putrescentiae]